jgi:hypothetical protein
MQSVNNHQGEGVDILAVAIRPSDDSWMDSLENGDQIIVQITPGKLS